MLFKKSVIVSGIFATLIALPSMAAETAPPSAPPEMACAYGVPGFNGSDPTILLGMYQISVPYEAGTKKLGPNAIVLDSSGEDTPKSVSLPIKYDSPKAGETYRFSILTNGGKSNFSFVVLQSKFTGKMGGVDNAAAAQGNASSMDMGPTSPGSTDSVVMQGLCFFD